MAWRGVLPASVRHPCDPPCHTASADPAVAPAVPLLCPCRSLPPLPLRPHQARAARIAAHGGRGLLIPAGGPRYTSNLLVTLHVLRRHLRCTLPVEVAWQVGREGRGMCARAR